MLLAGPTPHKFQILAPSSFSEKLNSSWLEKKHKGKMTTKSYFVQFSKKHKVISLSAWISFTELTKL